jgi:hypothetical protein
VTREEHSYESFSCAAIHKILHISPSCHGRVNFHDVVEPHVSTNCHIKPSIPAPLTIMRPKRVHVPSPCADTANNEPPVIVCLPAFNVEGRPDMVPWAI